MLEGLVDFFPKNKDYTRDNVQNRLEISKSTFVEAEDYRYLFCNEEGALNIAWNNDTNDADVSKVHHHLTYIKQLSSTDWPIISAMLNTKASKFDFKVLSRVIKVHNNGYSDSNNSE